MSHIPILKPEDASRFLFGVMPSTVASDIFVVVAIKDKAIEHWAAATTREKAVAAVEKKLLPGWTATLTRRHLTTHRATRLKMRKQRAKVVSAPAICSGHTLEEMRAFIGRFF
jgi:hypothetical protein